MRRFVSFTTKRFMSTDKATSLIKEYNTLSIIDNKLEMCERVKKEGNYSYTVTFFTHVINESIVNDHKTIYDKYFNSFDGREYASIIRFYNQDYGNFITRSIICNKLNIIPNIINVSEYVMKLKPIDENSRFYNLPCETSEAIKTNKRDIYKKVFEEINTDVLYDTFTKVKSYDKIKLCEVILGNLSEFEGFNEKFNEFFFKICTYNDDFDKFGRDIIELIFDKYHGKVDFEIEQWYSIMNHENCKYEYLYNTIEDILIEKLNKGDIDLMKLCRICCLSANKGKYDKVLCHIHGLKKSTNEYDWEISNYIFTEGYKTITMECFMKLIEISRTKEYYSTHYGTSYTFLKIFEIIVKNEYIDRPFIDKQQFKKRADRRVFLEFLLEQTIMSVEKTNESLDRFNINVHKANKMIDDIIKNNFNYYDKLWCDYLPKYLISDMYKIYDLNKKHGAELFDDNIEKYVEIYGSKNDLLAALIKLGFEKNNMKFVKFISNKYKNMIDFEKLKMDLLKDKDDSYEKLIIETWYKEFKKIE